MFTKIKLGKVKGFMSYNQITNMVKVVWIIKGLLCIGTLYRSHLHQQNPLKHFVKELKNNVLKITKDLI